MGQPQLLYSWAAVGWPTPGDPAAAAVAARLVSAHMPTDRLRLERAELWWSSGGRALVALGSGTAPDSATAPGANPARSLVEAVTATRDSLDRGQVQAAALAISREILLSARTPPGLARYLGEMFERTDRPASGQAFLRQLGRVDVAAVRRALTPEGTPERVEVRK